MHDTFRRPYSALWFGILVVVAGSVLAASVAQAQPAAPPAPTGLVVGSGNFFSPIVADLDAAVAFYRAIGFEVAGEPANADANPQLRAMFGLPDARLRWQIGRAPPLQGGVEIVEVTAADGQPVARRIQDPGTVMLTVVVRDVDATLARVKALGAPVVTRGGAPVTVRPPEMRIVVVQDPAGHFVELAQPRTMPRARARDRERRQRSTCGTPSKISGARSRCIATRSAFRVSAGFKARVSRRISPTEGCQRARARSR